MNIATLDLEGVLIPEIWIAFAKASGIEELKITTRDEPDYDKLMRYRLDILNKNNIKMADIEKVIGGLDLMEGALDFYNWLKSQTRVVILSDTFEQFAKPLMAKLGYPTLFCHNLVIGQDGSIQDYKLRMDNQKFHAVKAFQSLNFKVIASGDSYNDLSMLRAADKAILFKPTSKFASENSDLVVCEDYASLKQEFQKNL